MTERTWPLSIRVRRCAAFWPWREPCNGLLWPWQDVVRNYDPECGGRLRHHECHHLETEALWRDEYGERWTQWLNCEHRTERNDD